MGYRPGHPVFGFFDPVGKEDQLVCIRKDQLEKLDKTIEKINNIKDKCENKCYEITLKKKPLNPTGVRDLPSGCDKAILMSHSKGYPDAFSIQFKYYNGYLPSYQLKPNVEVIGCHLTGVRAHKGKDARGITTKFPDRRGGVGNRVLVKAAAMDKLIEKIESLKEKDCCPKITTVLLATTDDELHMDCPPKKEPAKMREKR